MFRQQSSLSVLTLAARRPLLALFFILLLFVVMPFDGEEHARAEHENLEGEEDDRDPFHGLEAF